VALEVISGTEGPTGNSSIREVWYVHKSVVLVCFFFFASSHFVSGSLCSCLERSKHRAASASKVPSSTLSQQALHEAAASSTGLVGAITELR
jgi:hypothetical protein